MIDRYIRPGDMILDIGGGPGQYSIHYARKGHDVTLLDLSGENVCFAKKKARQYGVKITAVEGNALDLSRFPDNTFDIVFLMGPLYHLMNGENRLQALREAARVLKPGGTLFSSFILLFGAVIYGLREIPETIFRPKEQRMFDVASREESLAIEAFTYAYMTTVKEAKALAASVPGLKTKTVFGQESILSPYKNVLDRYPRKIRTAWYDYALRFCEKEEYLNHSDHLMIVSEKEL
jgi:ubiquinone/menaquinone biosynthesis C-methylase UbiE